MQNSFQLPKEKVFLGSYCILEPFNDSKHGKDLWSSIAGHDEIFTFLPYGPWENETAFRSWLTSAIEKYHDQICFVVLDKSSKKAVGCTWLHDVSATYGSIEIGGIFYSPTLQRTRGSTEIFYLLASYIFDDLGYRRLQWRCDVRNEKSKNAAIRFGYTFEGIFRQHMLVKGLNRDTAWFSILDNEWPIRKESLEAWLAPTNFHPNGIQRVPLKRHESLVANFT